MNHDKLFYRYRIVIRFIWHEEANFKYKSSIGCNGDLCIQKATWALNFEVRHVTEITNLPFHKTVSVSNKGPN